MPVPCTHCGDLHPDGERFCSATGQPLPPPVDAPSSTRLPVEKGVWDLMSEAIQLYRSISQEAPDASG